MRKEVRQKIEQNERKKRTPKRGRPKGYSPSLKTDPTYWEAKLKELGLTMERGARDRLLYDHQSSFADEEKGERLLLHQVLDRNAKLGENAVRFYAELSYEHDVLAWQKILKQEKLLTAHNRRLVARKRKGLKSLLDRGKITKSVYEDASQNLVPAALAWQELGYEEDHEFDPEIDPWVPSK